MPLFWLMLVLFPITYFSQSLTDTTSIRAEMSIRFCLSPGLGIAQYYSNAYTQKLFSDTYSPVSILNNKPYIITGSPIAVSKITQRNYFQSNFFVSPVFRFGISIVGEKKKPLIFEHLIEFGLMQCSGTYTLQVKYNGVCGQGAFFNSGTYNDSVTAKYRQFIWFLGYSIQPSYRSYFLSLGVHAGLDFVKVSQHTNQAEIGIWNDADMGTHGSESGTGQRDTTVKLHIIEFPLQIGIGKIIKIRKLIFKPGIYYTYLIHQACGVYSVSIDVLFDIKPRQGYGSPGSSY